MSAYLAATPREAYQILKTPVFGDVRCIDALRVVVLLARVLDAREALERAAAAGNQAAARHVPREWRPLLDEPCGELGVELSILERRLRELHLGYEEAPGLFS
jgi:hypothetical protein